MSIFKEHKTGADRSASDRSRHKKKIEEAIKDGIHHIVSDESIIGQDGKKKFKIPVRGLKEYKFIFTDNSKNPRAATAPGKNIRKGQKIGDAEKDEQDGTGNKPSNKKGEEFYEVEITLEELAHYLFNDLELPDLEKKSIKTITSKKYRRHGYRSKGIRPRLDKKKTAIQRLKRKSAQQKEENKSQDRDDEDFPYCENDLVYKNIKEVKKYSSNAVIFFIMDISGSMTQEKKFLARSFFFLLYQFINQRYKKLEVVFISHDTDAYEVNEEQFFKRGSGGGTIVSSAIKKVDSIISARYHPDSWNIYTFQCSDGDNWPDDMTLMVEAAESVRQKCQLYGYCEIDPDSERLKWFGGDSRVSTEFEKIRNNNFKIAKIYTKHDIWAAFKRLLGSTEVLN
jgi:sporulation protein YhbH